LINIQDNQFTQNSGVNQNTIGGAVVVACDYMDAKWSYFTSADATNDHPWENDMQHQVSYLSTPDETFNIHLDKSLIAGNLF
jgi:hypothetical protein